MKFTDHAAKSPFDVVMKLHPEVEPVVVPFDSKTEADDAFTALHRKYGYGHNPGTWLVMYEGARPVRFVSAA